MKNKNNIAVIKSGAIGDMIMTVPSLRALRSVYPDGNITLFCGEQYFYVIKNCPYFDDAFLFDMQKIFKGSATEKLSEALKIIEKLKGYDISYVLNINSIWHSLPFFAGIPLRFGTGHRKSLFTSNTCICPTDMHRTEMWLNTALYKSISGSASLKYEFFPDKSFFSVPEKPYVAIATGGGRNVKTHSPQKIWDKFKDLINRIIYETDFNIALLGEEEDRPDYDENIRIKDYYGKTSLSDCYRIIENAEKFYGCDSGLTHLAACTQTPITAIFGPTDIKHTRPFNNENSVCVTSSLNCAPCEKKGKFGCNQNLCMQVISCDEVFNQSGLKS